MRNKLIISQPWGVLGDNLAYSKHYQNYLLKKVMTYISP